MFNNFRGSSDSWSSFRTYSYLSEPIFYLTNSVARCPLAGDTGFLGLKILFPSKVKYFDWFCCSNFCLKLSWGVFATYLLMLLKGLKVVGCWFWTSEPPSYLDLTNMLVCVLGWWGIFWEERFWSLIKILPDLQLRLLTLLDCFTNAC